MPNQLCTSRMTRDPWVEAACRAPYTLSRMALFCARARRRLTDTWASGSWRIADEASLPGRARSPTVLLWAEQRDHWDGSRARGPASSMTRSPNTRDIRNGSADALDAAALGSCPQGSGRAGQAGRNPEASMRPTRVAPRQTRPPFAWLLGSRYPVKLCLALRWLVALRRGRPHGDSLQPTDRSGPLARPRSPLAPPPSHGEVMRSVGWPVWGRAVSTGSIPDSKAWLA